MASTRRRNVAATAICAVGCLQMVGFLAGSTALRGIGVATAASPLPKVFSDVDGLETFASQFVLSYRRPDGTRSETIITPELYARLSGPYNRRNVYGAALSYAPRLPRDLWEPVFCYGLSGDGPLRTELGISREATQISLTIRTRTRGRHDVWSLEPACTR
jgi:hypothetical protein